MGQNIQSSHTVLSPIIQKILKNNLKEVIEYFETYPFTIENRDLISCNTPLAVAVTNCKDNDLSVVEYLLSKKANINVLGHEKYTILQEACYIPYLSPKPRFRLILLLLDYGADIYQKGCENLNILEYLESRIKMWRDCPNLHKAYIDIYNFIKEYERDQAASMMDASR